MRLHTQLHLGDMVAFIVMGVTIFIVWLVLRPRFPEFQVESVSLTNFSASNSSSSITGNWNFRFSVTNPNKKMSISYDVVQCLLFYNPDAGVIGVFSVGQRRFWGPLCWWLKISELGNKHATDTHTKMIGDVEKMVAVGLVWGATNAIMRRGALLWDQALKSTSTPPPSPQQSHLHKILASLKNWLTLLSIWQYTVPFFINLSASVTFFAILSHTPISLTVPVTNATTFAATAVFGMLLGEETRVGHALFGTGLIVLRGLALYYEMSL
uniref:Uncharacterized protein n=1 Tax=Fagus sylvatica TaxID=28930 RepID=A0A2N9H225_FAGSY